MSPILPKAQSPIAELFDADFIVSLFQNKTHSNLPSLHAAKLSARKYLEKEKAASSLNMIVLGADGGVRLLEIGKEEVRCVWDFGTPA